MTASVTTLLAALVGALSGIAGQLLAQRIATKRDDKNRSLAERQTRAIVRAQLEVLEPYIRQQVNDGINWNLTRIKGKAAYLMRIATDSDMIYRLSPEAVAPLMEFTDTLDLALDNMEILLGQYEARYSNASDGQAKADAGNDLRECLKQLFRQTYEKLNVAASFFHAEFDKSKTILARGNELETVPGSRQLEDK